MNGLPYYKAYPRDFLEGTAGMPLEMKGAYRLILDLIYMHGGALPDDARYIAGHLGCSARKWGGIRAYLLECGKIATHDGAIQNYRAIIELENLRKFQNKQRENRSKANSGNDLQKVWSHHTEPDTDNPIIPYGNQGENPAPNGHTIEAKPDASPPHPKPPDDAASAFDAWNAIAGKHGLPKAAKLTKTRRSHLAQRIADAGGLADFVAIVGTIPQSDFLSGRTKEQFRAHLDFVCQASSWQKLADGVYHKRPPILAAPVTETDIAERVAKREALLSYQEGYQ